jgi:hypothetical protein
LYTYIPVLNAKLRFITGPGYTKHKNIKYKCSIAVYILYLLDVQFFMLPLSQMCTAKYEEDLFCVFRFISQLKLWFLLALALCLCPLPQLYSKKGNKFYRLVSGY